MILRRALAALTVLAGLLVGSPAVPQMLTLGVGPGGFGGATFVGPLDAYAGQVVGAYSLGRLLSNYTANKAVNIIRASDNATTDVGFTAAGNFDVTTATTFCVATTCRAVTWYDQSGLSHDMTQPTAANQPALSFSVPGKFGASLSFDGVTSFLSAGNVADLSFESTNFSLLSWDYPTSISGFQIVINKGDGASPANSQYQLETSNSGNNHVGTQQFIGGASYVLEDPGTFPLTSWLSIGATRSAVNGNTSVYKSGVSVNFGTNAGTLNSTTNPTRIGSTGSSNFYAGNMDTTVFMRTVLTPAQVAALDSALARPYPLDNQPPVTAAYSLRRLLGTYTANKAVNISRASDSATTDIGFTTAGDFDVTTATTFCAATTCSVVTWYDQGANGVNVTQATPANRPTLLLAGHNGRPTVLFTTSSGTSLQQSGVTPAWTGNATGIAVHYPTTASAGTILSKGAAGGATLGSISWRVGAGANELLSIPNAGASTPATLPDIVSGSNISAFTRSGTQVTYYRNGVTNGAPTFATASGATTVWSIGQDYGGQFYSGEISEAIAYDSAVSVTNLNTIFSNEAVYYTPRPLDLQPPVTAAYSLRRLLSSYAANKAVNIVRASDSTARDVGFTSVGDFDVTTATTFCASTTCSIAKWYDQSANGYDLAQPTAANQPALVLSEPTLGGRPTISYLAASAQILYRQTTPALSQPFTYSFVINRTAGAGTGQTAVGSISPITVVAFGISTTNQMYQYAGSGFPTATVLDGRAHAIAAVVNSSTSKFAVDQAVTSPGNPGSATMGGLMVGQTYPTGQSLTGVIPELVLTGSAIADADNVAFQANEKAYYSIGAPLDGLAPTAAYGLRRLVSNYLGKAANIIRASDSTTTDIGFTLTGDFDVATATTFCAATTCRVVTLYDQSGSTYDVTQATAGQQPTLVLSEPTMNGRAAVKFLRASTTQLARATTPALSQPFSSTMVVERTGSSSSFSGMWSSPSNGTDYFGNAPGGVAYNFGLFTTSLYAAENVAHAVGGTVSSTAYNLVDGVAGPSANPGSGAVAGITIGNDSAGTGPMTGLVGELAVFPGAVATATLQAVQANEKTYYSTNFVGPLDNYPAVTAAYSMRRLRGAYAGPAINILRASDSATTDIGFTTSGDLDVTTATTFCASTTCSIATWYDQGGSGLNLLQGTVALQPSLVLSSAAINGRPAALFSAAGPNRMNAAATVAQPLSVFAVAQRTANFTTIQTLVGDNGSTNQMFFGNTANSFQFLAGGSIKGLTSGVADATAHALGTIFNGASSKQVIDQSITSPGTAGAGGLVSSIQIGNAGGVTSNPLTGLVGEAIVSPSAWVDANSQAFQANEKVYYHTP